MFSFSSIEEVFLIHLFGRDMFIGFHNQFFAPTRIILIMIFQSAPPTTNTNRRRRPDTSNRGTPPSKVANTSNASSKVSFQG